MITTQCGTPTLTCQTRTTTTFMAERSTVGRGGGFWGLAILAVAAGCEMGSDGSGVVADDPLHPVACQIGYMEDGQFTHIVDGDTVPAVFGSQGAMMFVGAFRVSAEAGQDRMALDVTLVRGGQAQSLRVRRIASLDEEGAYLIETIYIIIEWVGLDWAWDPSEEIILRIGADLPQGRVIDEARVRLAITGVPFPPHAKTPTP